MKKVAILGAGLSGLACAKFLEANGLYPDIYERRHRVGERFPNMEAVIQLMHRPIKDPFIFLSKRYGINLLPAGITHSIELHSPNNFTKITGYNLGYTTIRGNDDRSLERQLASQINKSKFIFNSTVTWQELEKNYDHVVIATGDPTISRELGVWKTDTEAFLMGCCIEGDFNIGTTKVWLNERLSKKCMVYFAPFDTKRASVCVVAIPSSQEELESLWSRTVEELKVTPIPKTEFKFEEYKIGKVTTKQIGKLYLTGAAAGFVEPFMGFGQIPSLLSGVYAAESILTGKDYNKLSAWYKAKYTDCLTLRKYINTLNNDDFDRMVSLYNLPFVKRIIYSTNIPVLSIAAAAVRTKNFLSQSRSS